MSEEHNFHPEWDRQKGDRDFHRAIQERFGRVLNISNPFMRITSRGGLGDFENLVYNCLRGIIIILMTIYDRIEALESKSGIESPKRIVVPNVPKAEVKTKPKPKMGRPRKTIEIGSIDGVPPYKMTATEYFDAYDLDQLPGRVAAKHQRIYTTHRSSVEKALKMGIDVEDRVMKRYPEFNQLIENIRLKKQTK
jgi:hypothetical protein